MLGTSDAIAEGAPAIDSESRRICATYRGLIQRGLESTEAASLVAHLNGLRVGDASWTLDEVNHVLFLRHLYRSGRFTEVNPVQRLLAA